MARPQGSAAAYAGAWEGEAGAAEAFGGQGAGEEEGWPEELRASDRLLEHSLNARVVPESLQPLAP